MEFMKGDTVLFKGNIARHLGKNIYGFYNKNYVMSLGNNNHEFITRIKEKDKIVYFFFHSSIDNDNIKRMRMVLTEKKLKVYFFGSITYFYEI